MSRPFPARFAGRCAGDCGLRIEEGDLIAFVDDETMHADCARLDADADRRMAAREQVCTSCWTVHAGECL